MAINVSDLKKIRFFLDRQSSELNLALARVRPQIELSEGAKRLIALRDECTRQSQLVTREIQILTSVRVEVMDSEGCEIVSIIPLVKRERTFVDQETIG